MQPKQYNKAANYFSALSASTGQLIPSFSSRLPQRCLVAPTLISVFIGLSSLIIGCGGPEPIDAQRYTATDKLIQLATENLVSSSTLQEIVDIDHSRLGGKAGSPMAPARVLIFSNPKMDAQLISINPLVALDLPFRLLAYENNTEQAEKYVYNSFDYLISRYQLDPQKVSVLRQSYEQGIGSAIRGLPSAAFTPFALDEMQPAGIITIKSPYDFQETLKRVNAAIDSQSDTMHFGVVDFQAAALENGIEIPSSHLILFGGPGPGGKAMADAPTLGLDGFCQKLLVWQDATGATFLSFNDLLALAERQGAKKSIALRVINFRLSKTFHDALEPDQDL